MLGPPEKALMSQVCGASRTMLGRVNSTKEVAFKPVESSRDLAIPLLMGISVFPVCAMDNDSVKSTCPSADVSVREISGSKIAGSKDMHSQAGRWWLMPVVLATQEAEMRRIVIRSQPGKIV
jgi:hypothetical protein